MCAPGHKPYAPQMSSTEYSRKHQVRVDDRERNALARSVMRSIEIVGADLANGKAHYGDAWAEPMRDVELELRTLRSLLERLTD